ncbi:MAG: YcjX family protein, partial [Pseudomonadota bacterium]
VSEARGRAEFVGAETAALALASLRATTEETRDHNGEQIECVRGMLLTDDGDRGRQAAFYPGALPDDPADLLRRAREGARNWLDSEYGAMTFAPAAGQSATDGLPHIRLDRAAEFLLGDML